MKSILLHAVPLIVVALAAIFGLNAEEQSTVSQVLTDIIVGIFTVGPIIYHHVHVKKLTAKK